VSKLTDKQQRFVDEYMIDLNATQAAIRTGYSSRTADVQGPRLLGNVGIARAIAEHKAELAARAAVTAEYVLTSLKDVVTKSMQAEPVYDKFGHPTGEWVFDSKGATGALNLLGKHIGMFNEKVDVNHTGTVGVQIVDDIKAAQNGTG
jgi:phage terminase small subunit